MDDTRTVDVTPSAPLPLRPLGRTGLWVPVLGLGTGGLGDPPLSEEQAGTVLNRAVDFGLSLIDAAPSYGLAEERIGRHLSWRRRDFVLVTKVGYGVPGIPDWTGASIRGGIEAALARTQTDHLDVVLLHSCPLETLQRGELSEALLGAKAAGLVRAVGYSGENEALAAAIQSQWCEVIEVSVNPFDQRALSTAIPAAVERGIGVLAKRPLANAPWRFGERPVGDYALEYWDRRAAMGLKCPLPEDEYALRFAAFAPGVDAAILGTRRPEHVEAAARMIKAGPLSPELVRLAKDAFAERDRGWAGQI
jgi:aryl-alcohol dehydrogenase-like predicted oxidoreductase